MKEKTLEKLTANERKFLGFHLACRLEDYEKELKKNKSFSGAGLNQFQELEELVYTKLIPESWSGPNPQHWKKK